MITAGYKNYKITKFALFVRGGDETGGGGCGGRGFKLSFERLRRKRATKIGQL